MSETLMMYSSAATATSDWRANGLDLERVARDGRLDIFVDQGWAGAWGEAGVRRQTFWNAPILGWTYQLQYYRRLDERPFRRKFFYGRSVRTGAKPLHRIVPALNPKRALTP